MLVSSCHLLDVLYILKIVGNAVTQSDIFTVNEAGHVSQVPHSKALCCSSLLQCSSAPAAGVVTAPNKWDNWDRHVGCNSLRSRPSTEQWNTNVWNNINCLQTALVWILNVSAAFQISYMSAWHFTATLVTNIQQHGSLVLLLSQFKVLINKTV